MVLELRPNDCRARSEWFRSQVLTVSELSPNNFVVTNLNRTIWDQRK